MLQCEVIGDFFFLSPDVRLAISKASLAQMCLLNEISMSFINWDIWAAQSC